MEKLILKAESYSITYTDACNVKSNKDTLTFDSRIVCPLGPKKRFSDETISGIEELVPNPVLIDYKELGNWPKSTAKRTGVTAYMEHFKGFELQEEK